MKIKNVLRLNLTVLAVLLSLACDDDAPTGPGAAESPLTGMTLEQVDRMGLPTINTALVSSDDDKNAFNRGAPADDEAEFTDVLIGTIQARFGLDDDAAAALADFVLPDVLPLGDLSGFPNGRRLDDDVIDTVLSLVFGVFGPAVPALQSDNVDANDTPFVNQFPYLGTPHTL